MKEIIHKHFVIRVISYFCEEKKGIPQTFKWKSKWFHVCLLKCGKELCIAINIWPLFGILNKATNSHLFLLVKIPNKNYAQSLNNFYDWTKPMDYLHQISSDDDDKTMIY